MPQLIAACPTCKAQLSAAPDLAGRQVTCPKCGTQFLFPIRGAVALEPVSVQLDEPSGAPTVLESRVAAPERGAADSNQGQSPDASVKARLDEWFAAQTSDRFIVFLPDTTTPATELGAAGIIITDQRVVFRNSEENGSIPLDEQGELRLKKIDGDYSVTHCHGRRMRHRRPLCRLAPDDAGQLIHNLDELKQSLRTVRT
jgi:DNA-directed RNA polymerase subunit RPC12/RpoP